LATNEPFGVRLPRIEKDETSSFAAFAGATMVNVALM